MLRSDGAQALRELVTEGALPWPVEGLYRLNELPEPAPLSLWNPGFPEWESKVMLAPRTVVGCHRTSRSRQDATLDSDMAQRRKGARSGRLRRIVRDAPETTHAADIANAAQWRARISDG